MPHQTRSRSALSPKAKQAEEPPAAAAAAAASAEQGDSAAVPVAKEPQEQTQQEKIDSPRDEFQASTPDANGAPSPPRSRARSSRSWEERRDHRDGAGRDGNIFSPPGYKMDRYAHSAHREQVPTHPGAAMDQATRRDFDQLDLNEDFMGPEDPLMMGSFAEESPPRVSVGRRSPSLERDQQLSERKRPASTRGPSRSPPPHPYAYQQQRPYSASRHSYGRSREGYHSTPSGRRPPPPGYPYGNYPQSSPPAEYGGDSRSSPRFYGGYSPYHHYPAESYWDGPPGPYPFDQEDDIPPPPPSSTKKRPIAAEPVISPSGTPEKALKPRSPFRSPPPSRQKFKRSPDFAASPYFGTQNSFSLDTPIATLGAAEFSPMGPAMQEFDENAPLPFGGELSLSRSNSQESPVIRRRTTKEETSPLTGFMNELSPFEGLQGIARSPVVGGYDEAGHAKPVTASATRSAEPRIHSTPHGSVKKALWPRADGQTSSTPGRVRLEIGSAGALSTRKSLEGINSMIHARHPGQHLDTPSRHDAYSRARPSHMRGRPHPGAFRGEMATPIKSTGYHPRQTPITMHRPPYPGSASKFGPPGHHPPSASKARFGPPPPPSVPLSGGKENKKKVVTPKHTPCNCKKSKCLKLYCDCFAALEFCKNCNCSDCGNTPTAGAIREKAIKDTKAKNANAFVPRFNGKVQDASPVAGHNMGCRCKRSECLKKYCECFQAGVICGNKCKCVDCLNFAGSQALIDKRRKIKDQRGADFAMRVADEAWKQGRTGGPPPRKPAAPAAAGSSAPPPTPRQPSKSPPVNPMPPPHMMQPSPRGPPPLHGAPHGHSGQPPHGGPHHGGHPHGAPSHSGPPHGPPHPGMHGHPHHPGPHGHPHHPYHGMHPYMRGPPPGYSHMGMPMTPAGYPPHHGPPPPHMHGESPHPMYAPHHGPSMSAQRKTDLKRPAPTSRPKPVTPAASTPRTPGIRVQFDPASSRKKRKISPGQDEATLPFFGLRFPAQPKTTALAIFSFLSNDDLYNAGLVCKSWSQLAMDDELWKFEA